MADTLASYVVGVQVKGQNVAMKEIHAIKKAGKDLAKTKITANVGSNKTAAANFRGVRAEINARKELERVKRSTAANSGRSAIAKAQAQRAEAVANKFKSAGGAASNAGSTFLSSGAQGLVQALPGIGGLFAAASSAIEAASAQYVAGVTARKNINLVTTNYTKAFKDSFANGTAAAVSGGMFGTRETQNFYADLVGQGVNASTFTGENQKLLDDFAKAQGVGSVAELFQRIQSGSLKEGKNFGGLTKTDIDILQGQGDLLNDRYTKESGMQGILRTLARRNAEITAAGSSAESGRLYDVTRTEAQVRETEESDQDAISGALGPSYGDMRANRFRDARSRARNQNLNRTVNQVGNTISSEANSFANDLLSGDFRRVAARIAPGGGMLDPSLARERIESAVENGVMTPQQGQQALQRLFPGGSAPANGGQNPMGQRVQRYEESVDELSRATDRTAGALNRLSNTANGNGQGVNPNTGY